MASTVLLLASFLNVFAPPSLFNCKTKVILNYLVFRRQQHKRFMCLSPKSNKHLHYVIYYGLMWLGYSPRCLWIQKNNIQSAGDVMEKKKSLHIRFLFWCWAEICGRWIRAVKHKWPMSYKGNGSGVKQIKMNKCYWLGTHRNLSLMVNGSQ